MNAENDESAPLEDKHLIEQRVRNSARKYFQLREDQEVAKDEMLREMLLASLDNRVTQEEITNWADLRDEEPEHARARGWSFHRTRIQQFLRESRIRRRDRTPT